MKQIYLVGMMGSGKTTVAKELGKLMGLPVIDLDVELEKKVGKSIAEIFREKGEEEFRRLETGLLTFYARSTDAVFATGGGVVLRRENRDWMRAAGTVVFLEATPENLWKRVAKEKGRPLLEDFDPQRKLISLLRSRQPLYEECAHIKIKTDEKTPDQVAREISNRLNENNQS